MSRRITALVLLCLSTSALALSPTAQDNRIAIVVKPSERNQVLYDMRELLHGLFNMHNALAARNMNGLALSTQPMAELVDRLPAGVKAKAPDEFMQIAIGMRESLQAIARDAETKGDMSLTHAQMAELMTYCSGCHDTYRFETPPAKARR